MNSPFQEIIEVKNCRKYLKRCYILLMPIDEDLLESFSNFGFVEITNFSKFSPLAKDTFKLDVEETLQIAGVIADKQMFITISKQSIELLSNIEQCIHQWFDKER
jgi:hypothetical protein